MFFYPFSYDEHEHEQAIWVLKKKKHICFFLILRHVLVYVLSSEKAVLSRCWFWVLGVVKPWVFFRFRLIITIHHPRVGGWVRPW